MENEALPTSQPVQPLPQTPTIAPIPASTQTNLAKIILLSLLGLIIVAGAVLAGIQIGKNQTTYQQPVVVQPTISPTQLPTISPTDIPETTTPAVSIPPSVATTPSPSPTPRPFSEEEKLMRKILAGFEMYVANGNTAGALTFFTPPLTEKAKEKYEYIHTKNLLFTLKSWSFVQDSNYLLGVEEIKGGYRVRTIECRSNTTYCPTLFLELVRDETAENGFLIDRYYDTTYSYQNNLGEEIKYQGFGL
jgi:hypothetical protein